VNALQRGFDRIVRRIDRVQRARPWLAFPFAVLKKFGEDDGGYLAALISYYGFFSLFPLLLVFVTVLGLLLSGDPGLAHSIQTSALAHFPVIGDQIKVRTLRGSGLALAIGVIVALWAGLGVTQAAQHAMNQVWGVKREDRPNFWISRLRGLASLGVLGTITVGSTILSGLAAAVDVAGAVRLLTLAGSLAANLALFLLSYRILTRRRLTWMDVLPGAVFAAVAWSAVQLVGNLYVSHLVARALPAYGAFAFVLGLLVWIFLGARITLLGAEINVVRKERRWPRSLVEP
jgi:YihY family inner membrane protein